MAALLGHANVAFAIETYQHVLPGMQADAARTIEAIAAPARPPSTSATGSTRWNIRENATRTR